MHMLESTLGDITGMHMVIINRSNIVGKPLMHMALRKNATITVCHSRTVNMEKYTRDADILVVAVGKPGFVKKEMVSEKATVVDVGINVVEGKVIGDVEPHVVESARYLTPVPGGVGPVTTAMVFQNLLEAVRLQNK